METLLKKLEIIDFKYKVNKEENAFNLFTILRDINDEVNLHSRFIYELLNPNGSHHFNKIFLEFFLDATGIIDFTTQGVTVNKEKDNVDIIITNNSKQVIIIENKIGARDQDKQLFRYYDLMIKAGYLDKNIKMIYLTLDGKPPTSKSLGELKENPNIDTLLINISYKEQIISWITNCLKEVALFPELRECLNQYKKTINYMTGNTMTQAEKTEVLKLMSESNNSISAFKIIQNWVHVRWHTEWDFWSELEKLVSRSYTILDIRKYSRDYLNSTIYKSRNREPWYGLMFPISTFGDTDMCLMVERGDAFLYYGIIMVKENKTLATNDFVHLADLIDPFCEWKKTQGWLGGRFSRNQINFDAFNSLDTLNLANPEKRQRIINELFDEIQNFIVEIKTKLN